MERANLHPLCAAGALSLKQNAIAVGDRIALRKGRVHEVSGAGADVFAAIAAAEQDQGVLWIGLYRDIASLCPTGLQAYLGIEGMIIVEAVSRGELLWAADQALRAEGGFCVILEMPDMLSLKESRRLQLAAEQGGGLGLILLRWGLPAALLLSAMSVSGLAHASGWSVGGIAPWLGTAGFVTMGALIGTRFSGISFVALRQCLWAGLAVTAVACLLAVIAALPVAAVLGLGQATVLAAYAPGGFETMVALGVVLGANPGFVAAAHVGRLIFLTGLIPIVLGRARQSKATPRG